MSGAQSPNCGPPGYEGVMTHRKAPDDTTDGRRRADPLRATARPSSRERSSIVASVAEIVAAYPEATEALLSDAVKRRPDEALRIVVACIKANPAGAAEVLRIVRESPFLKAKVTMDNLMGVLLPDLLDLERAELQEATSAVPTTPATPETPAPPLAEASDGEQPMESATVELTPEAAPPAAEENGNNGDDFTEPVVAALRRAREAALMNQQLQDTIAEQESGGEPAAGPPLLNATQGPAAWEVPSAFFESEDSAESEAEDDVVSAEAEDELVVAEAEDDADEGADGDADDGTVLHLYPEFDEEEDEPVAEAESAPISEPEPESEPIILPAPTPEPAATDLPVVEPGPEPELEPEAVEETEPEPEPEPEVIASSSKPESDKLVPSDDEPDSDDLTFADYLSGGVPDHAPLLFGLTGDPLPGPSEREPAVAASEPEDEPAVARGPVPVPPREVTVITPEDRLREFDAGTLNQAVVRLEGFPADASLWGLVTDSGNFEVVLRTIDGEDRVVARFDDMVRHPEALSEIEIADRKLNLQDLIIGVDLFRPGGPEDPVEALPEPSPVDEVVADIRAFERAASDYRGRGDLDA